MPVGQELSKNVQDIVIEVVTYVIRCSMSLKQRVADWKENWTGQDVFIR